MAFDGSTCSRGWQWRIIKTVCKIRTRLSFMAMAISSTTVTRVTWATHHYDKPSNSQLWVWMALLKNTSQSISWRNVHFCIRSYSTLHTVYCGALPPPPKMRIAPFARLLQWKFINSPLFFVSVQVIVATTVSTSMQFGHIWVTYWVSHYNINQIWSRICF